MEWIRGPLDDKGRENGAKHLKDKETQATVRAYQKTHQGFGGFVSPISTSSARLTNLGQ